MDMPGRLVQKSKQTHARVRRTSAMGRRTGKWRAAVARRMRGRDLACREGAVAGSPVPVLTFRAGPFDVVAIPGGQGGWRCAASRADNRPRRAIPGKAPRVESGEVRPDPLRGPDPAGFTRSAVPTW